MEEETNLKKEYLENQETMFDLELEKDLAESTKVELPEDYKDEEFTQFTSNLFHSLNFHIHDQALQMGEKMTINSLYNFLLSIDDE